MSSLPLEYELDLCDSLLKNRIQQEWWDGTSEINLQGDSGFYLACFTSYCLVGLLRGKSVLCCDPLCGEVHIDRNWQRSLANSWWGIEASIQQLIREWIQPTTTWVNLEVDPPPIEPSDETAHLAVTLIVASWDTQLNHPCILDPQKLWGGAINCLLFQALWNKLWSSNR